MEKTRMQILIDRYGKINIVIVTICVVFLFINSIIVSETVLSQLASGKYLVMESGGDYFYICIYTSVFYICCLMFLPYYSQVKLLRKK